MFRVIFIFILVLLSACESLVFVKKLPRELTLSGAHGLQEVGSSDPLRLIEFEVIKDYVNYSGYFSLNIDFYRVGGVSQESLKLVIRGNSCNASPEVYLTKVKTKGSQENSGFYKFDTRLELLNSWKVRVEYVGRREGGWAYLYSINGTEKEFVLLNAISVLGFTSWGNDFEVRNITYEF